MKKMGRPLKFTDVDALQRAIDVYFFAIKKNRLEAKDIQVSMEGFTKKEIKQIEDIYTLKPLVSGLALHLDVATETLRGYAKKDNFSATLTRARQRVEVSLEERLDGNGSQGAQFNLKNNFNWKDKTETELSGGLALSNETDAELDARIASLTNAINKDA